MYLTKYHTITKGLIEDFFGLIYIL